MANRGKCFTPEEIKILEANPYTRRVSAGSLSITMEAKQRVLELYETGITSRQIVEALGYDYEILGGQRMKNIVRNTRKEAASPCGLHEGYSRVPAARMAKEEIEQLDNSAMSYARLKNEVIYLREEVRFLKKLSQEVIQGKRGR